MKVSNLNKKAARLNAMLHKHKIEDEVIDKIMFGADEFRKTNYDALRDWFAGAMEMMDTYLDYETKRTIRENCACCKTGKYDRLARQIFRAHDNFTDRFTALSVEKEIIGYKAVMLSPDKIRIYLSASPKAGKCHCLYLPQKPMSCTYCMCCGGHLKHHIETALGIRTECTVISSLQSSSGTEVCKFDFQILYFNKREKRAQDINMTHKLSYGS